MSYPNLFPDNLKIFIYMANNLTYEFGSEELLKEGHQALQEQLKVIESAFQKLMTSDNELVLNLYTLLFSVFDSCKTILILTPKYHLRDCFLTARTIYELTLNIGYIAVGGKDMLNKAKRHLQQKSYRDLQRKLNIESINISVKSLGIEDLYISSQLQEALDEFTTKKGFEIRSWDESNVFKKIDTISKKYGPKVKDILNIGLFNIYRHASEIAHGSLFGIFYIIGATELRNRPQNSNELLILHRQHLSLIILTICLLIEANLTFFNEFHDLKDEISQSEKITLSFSSKTKNDK